jgi:transcriptional regulator with XRE-family HTH domain
VKRTRHIDFIKAVGLRIRELRTAKGLTQETLGNLCDVEESTINRIELGKANTSLTHIKSIADALEVDPKELFELSNGL